MSLILSGSDGLSDIDGSAATPAIRGTDANTGIFFPAADTIAFAEGGVEAMRLDSAGRLLVGTTTSSSSGGVKQVLSSSTGAFLLLHQSATSVGGGAIGTDSGSGLQFFTQTGAIGAETYAERMRLDSSGNLGIGTTSPRSVGGYTSLGLNNTTGILIDSFVGGTRTSGIATTASSMTVGTITSIPLAFLTADTERARIDSSGRLLVGGTAATAKITVNQNSQSTYSEGISVYFSGSSYWNIVNGTGNHLYFGFTGLDRSYINSSTGAFVAMSDQRLKKNIADIGYGLSSVLALRPVSYNMKDQEDAAEKTFGFIAQEALEVLPESVSQMMNGMYGMDKTVIVPVLVKAIQEQQALITQLQADVAALKGAA
jgi:hypothetical protein